MAHVNPILFQSATERRLRDELLADKDIQRALRHLDEHPAGSASLARRRRLLSDAFRLTHSTAPGIMGALASCQETLGYEGTVEVFVHPEPGLRVAAVHRPPETPAIVLSARLLEVLPEAELRFVLGHELGHLAFGHFALPLPATALAGEGSGRIVRNTTALRLYQWSRAAESSADRAGLLCARDAEAAASALFKLASGMTSAPVKSELRAHTRQVDALLSGASAREKPREDEETLGLFSTHAFGPPRLRGIAAFARTRTFLRIAGRYASEEGHLDEDADRLLADDLRELEPPSQQEEMPAHAELPRRAQETTLSERARLVQHLTLVAAPDGNVSDEGFLELRRVAEALSVPAWLVDEALRAASHPLD
ncbi:M48 family metallopeptidase [Archangium violaceum]|uniref:M48 family metallopeptidase n=1 Tax=Archangium violaceum TaxID=83451 RepID=UPI00193BC1EB|nr:M48 family metallopeptidase [Archangium violaceum]QRK06577.1 M48 family metallopeptidase [Archangium violaceum]